MSQPRRILNLGVGKTRSRQPGAPIPAVERDGVYQVPSEATVGKARQLMTPIDIDRMNPSLEFVPNSDKLREFLEEMQYSEGLISVDVKNSPLIRRQAEQRCSAIQFLIANMEAANMDEQAQKWWNSFIAWILATTEDKEERRKTPWMSADKNVPSHLLNPRNANLVRYHGDMQALIDILQDLKHRFVRQLEELALRGPTDLTEAYLYYKYIVCGAGQPFSDVDKFLSMKPKPGNWEKTPAPKPTPTPNPTPPPRPPPTPNPFPYVPPPPTPSPMPGPGPTPKPLPPIPEVPLKPVPPVGPVEISRFIPVDIKAELPPLPPENEIHYPELEVDPEDIAPASVGLAVQPPGAAPQPALLIESQPPTKIVHRHLEDVGPDQSMVPSPEKEKQVVLVSPVKDVVPVPEVKDVVSVSPPSVPQKVVSVDIMVPQLKQSIEHRTPYVSPPSPFGREREREVVSPRFHDYERSSAVGKSLSTFVKRVYLDEAPPPQSQEIRDPDAPGVDPEFWLLPLQDPQASQAPQAPSSQPEKPKASPGSPPPQSPKPWKSRVERIKPVILGGRSPGRQRPPRISPEKGKILLAVISDFQKKMEQADRSEKLYKEAMEGIQEKIDTASSTVKTMYEAALENAQLKNKQYEEQMNKYLWQLKEYHDHYDAALKQIEEANAAIKKLQETPNVDVSEYVAKINALQNHAKQQEGAIEKLMGQIDVITAKHEEDVQKWTAMSNTGLQALASQQQVINEQQERILRDKNAIDELNSEYMENYKKWVGEVKGWSQAAIQQGTVAGQWKQVGEQYYQKAEKFIGDLGVTLQNMDKVISDQRAAFQLQVQETNEMKRRGNIVLYNWQLTDNQLRHALAEVEYLQKDRDLFRTWAETTKRQLNLTDAVARLWQHVSRFNPEVINLWTADFQKTYQDIYWLRDQAAAYEGLSQEDAYKLFQHFQLMIQTLESNFRIAERLKMVDELLKWLNPSSERTYVPAIEWRQGEAAPQIGWREGEPVPPSPGPAPQPSPAPQPGPAPQPAPQPGRDGPGYRPAPSPAPSRSGPSPPGMSYSADEIRARMRTMEPTDWQVFVRGLEAMCRENSQDASKSEAEREGWKAAGRKLRPHAAKVGSPAFDAEAFINAFIETKGDLSRTKM